MKIRQLLQWLFINAVNVAHVVIEHNPPVCLSMNRKKDAYILTVYGKSKDVDTVKP